MSKATPETASASGRQSRQARACSFPRTRPSSAAPASIIVWAQAPWATMWIVELVKRTITGHISTPRPKSRLGQRYARQARRLQTSSPTTARASRQSASSRNPVANSQWTCSAGGCIVFQVLDQAGRDQQRKHDPGADDQQRRLDEQPPEALPVRVQDGQPVRLQEAPRDPAEHRQRAERGYEPHP